MTPTPGGAPVVGACGSLAAPGTWENITPPPVWSQISSATYPKSACPYGVGSFVLDPVNSGTVYLGTCEMGIWKTTDCGATWKLTNTGKRRGFDSSLINTGRQWTFAIDPSNPNTLYTNVGYSHEVANGAFKSVDGGVNWQQIYPPASARSSTPADIAHYFQYNFVGKIALDPTDPTHLLLSFHEGCADDATLARAQKPNPPPFPFPWNRVCFCESHDGGETWKLYYGSNPDWIGTEGQTLWFLGDSKTVLWGSASNGLWYTRNGLAGPWSAITAVDSKGIPLSIYRLEGHGSGQIYAARDGSFYLAVSSGVLHSNGVDITQWTLIPDTANLMGQTGLASDGKSLFAAAGVGAGNGPGLYAPFMSSSTAGWLTGWTAMASPKMTDGDALAVDAGHRILYSSNGEAGFWRVVIP